MKRFYLILLLLLLSISSNSAQITGTIVPATCTQGTLFILTSRTPNLTLYCTSPNVYSPYWFRGNSYAMPDNSAVNLFDIAIPTANTGCAVHTSFTYTATDATNTVSHSGIVIFAVVNQLGTVTVNTNDSGEAIAGTGCGAACDAWSATVASTTATATAKFNNTLSVTGAMTVNILNDSCPSVVWK